MGRFARAVAPGLPHHITQRGNRRQETFVGAEDYQASLALMGVWCSACAAGPSTWGLVAVATSSSPHG